MYESCDEVRCRSDGWPQGGGGTASRIGPEPLFVCYGDGQTNRRGQARMMSLDDDVRR